MAILALPTDFGTRDGYVAAMKGVLAALAPGAGVFDVSHEIRPHDIRAGAWALRQYWNLFPPGTIHVAVVDPGVGAARRALLVRAGGHTLIGPDNGIFSWVLAMAGRWRAFSLKDSVRRPGASGDTFDGRDRFAYAAGLLAAGSDWRDLVAGPARNIKSYAWPRATRSAGRITGRIVHLDQFGNAITSIPANWIAGKGKDAVIRCNDFVANKIQNVYDDVPEGMPLVHPESTGLLELSVNKRDASSMFGFSIGDSVVLDYGPH